MENVGAVTDEKREARLKKRRERERGQIAKETPENQQKRRAKGREQWRKRLERETPEQRARRLASSRKRESRRRAQETPEQREQRREAGRAQWTRACARETQEQREARLAKGRAWFYRPVGKRARFDSNLRRSYGVSREEYDRIVIASCGRCDACGKQDTDDKKGLCLDHDHDTGLPRGMLCWTCNVALGHLQDSPLLIAKLAAYASGIGRSA